MINMNNTEHMSGILNQFIKHCDSTLNELQSAHTTEMVDANTNNNSFLGMLVSWQSNSQNNAVAGKLNALQHEAMNINGMLNNAGFFKTGMITPLNVDFNGDGIQYAEQREHSSSFVDYLSDGAFSSGASFNTATQISFAMGKVQSVRSQAYANLNSLQYSQPWLERTVTTIPTPAFEAAPAA